MLNVIMLNVIMLSVIMVNVMAPQQKVLNIGYTLALVTIIILGWKNSQELEWTSAKKK